VELLYLHLLVTSLVTLRVLGTYSHRITNLGLMLSNGRLLKNLQRSTVHTLLAVRVVMCLSLHTTTCRQITLTPTFVRMLSAGL